ncbi:MAG: sigma-70 family RNA polymerase sigma factor, partial [Acidobacteria bacterium]|nr:sigma-70 family RNA polymerase sigma factor [Acidobacteriota bacterium]
MTATMTDEKLLHKASRGDEAAFRILYERHRATVFRFAYRMLGSVELAEEVTHDCFLGLLKAPARFDPARGASLSTYLYAAVRNLSAKHFRRHGGDVSIEDIEGEPTPVEHEGPL